MIDISDLSFSYRASQNVLHDVTAHIRKGELTAILGNNGAGKSTLLGCINRILKPESGIITVNEKNVETLSRRDLSKEVALVAQQSVATNISVFESVLLGRRPYIEFAPTDHDLEVVAHALSRLNLEDFALRNIDELSGGEFQKVIIARALAQETQILLLDEPTNNLDPYNQIDVMTCISELVRQEGIAAVAVMHDLNLSMRFCDSVIFMKNGTIHSCESVQDVTAQTIQEVYGISVDILEHQGNRVIVAQ